MIIFKTHKIEKKINSIYSYPFQVTFYFWDSILNSEARFKPESKTKSQPLDIMFYVSGSCDNKSIRLVTEVLNCRNKKYYCNQVLNKFTNAERNDNHKNIKRF